MNSWPLTTLLDLRRSEVDRATGRLALAERDCRTARAEAAAALGEATGTAARALAVWTIARGGAHGAAVGFGQERFRERLRMEATRLALVAEETGARARGREAEVAQRREALRLAAVRHEAAAWLEAAWRRRRAAAVVRRDEVALDDRPWPPMGGPGAPVSASRTAAGRRAPDRTGW